MKVTISCKALFLKTISCNLSYTFTVKTVTRFFQIFISKSILVCEKYDYGSDFYNDLQLLEDFETVRKLAEETQDPVLKAPLPDLKDVFEIKDQISRLWNCPRSGYSPTF